MARVLVKAKFDSKKVAKNVQDVLESMSEDLMGVAMSIDDAEEASPYKVDRISIDKAISRIDKDLELLDKYCSTFFKNLKTEL